MKFEIIPDYQKYRWFFTSTEKLVVGGKTAEQNDELLKKLKLNRDDFVVMHTSSPGSPFSVIIAEPKQLKKTDVQEAATFTACFSKEWLAKKKKTKVNIFSLSKLRKSPTMKPGTWQVLGRTRTITVSLKLFLIKQQGKLRAVPKVLKKETILAKIIPGDLDKISALKKIQEFYPFSNEEILSALPPGKIKIIK